MKIISYLAIAVLLAACSTQTIYINKGQSYNYDPKANEIQHFLLGGIGQEQTLDAERVCGKRSRVAKVAVKQTFGDVIIGFVTFGILSPRHAEVYCRRKR